MNYNLLIHSSLKITLLGIKYKQLSNLPNQVPLNFIFSHLWEFYNTFRELRQPTVFLETNFTACRNNSIYKLHYLFNYSDMIPKTSWLPFQILKKKKKNQGRKMLVASLLRVWHFITTYNWLFKPYFTYSKKSILFFSLFSKYFFLLTFFLFSFWFFFHFSLFNKMKKRNFKKIQTSKLNHKSVCFGLYLC